MHDIRLYSEVSVLGHGKYSDFETTAPRLPIRKLADSDMDGSLWHFLQLQIQFRIYT